MEHIAIDDIDQPPTISPATVLRPMERELGTTDVAVNYYELVPGDAFGFDFHRHLDQEEVFYVMAGTATFRTEAGDVEVAAGEMIRFAPGELQLGRNEGEERVRALAIGTPRETTEIEYRRDCPDCGEETIQTPSVDREAVVFEIRCEKCGSVADRIAF